MSKPQPKKSSGIPVIIIVLVAIVAVVVGLVYWNGSKPQPGPKPTPTPIAANTPDMRNAPLGANPPNYLGSPNAAVTVEEFADFQCPACGATHPVMKQIQSIFGPRIKLIFRHFPLPMHNKAYDASVAAEAAGMQGKFWDMHNLLYTNQQTWSNDPNYKEVFKGYAGKIGLDIDKWETDMAGIAAKGRVDADLQRGKALNIGTTPTIFIDGRSVPFDQMNVPTMQRLIEDELKAAQKPTQPPPAGGNSNAANSSK